MSSTASDGSFVTVGKGIYLCRPVEPEAVDALHPTVILLFGWMGAKLPHLQKYTAVYHDRYPNTTILLVRSEAEFFWSSEGTRRKRLLPVVEILVAIGCIPSVAMTSSPVTLPEPLIPLLKHRILVHTFSNGGSWQLTTLSNMITRLQSSSAFENTTSAIILDSCPGGAGLHTSRRAFSGGIRNPLIRILVNLVVTLIFCFQLVTCFLTRKRSGLEVMKAHLNDPRLLPWMHKGTPRLYIYSSGDEIVLADFVEKHIREARDAGLNVQSEKFGRESMHVAHAKADPERYWAAVGRVWKEALGKMSVI